MGPRLELVRGAPSDGATLTDLGEHMLRDVRRPEWVFQLCHPSLPSEFPPLAAPTRVYYGTDEVSDPGGLERDWRLAVRGELLVHGFPGGHFFLDSEQEAVTERVARDVEAAMAHR